MDERTTTDAKNTFERIVGPIENKKKNHRSDVHFYKNVKQYCSLNIDLIFADK